MSAIERIFSKSTVILGSKYRVVRRIGGGSFGDIYLGIHIHNGEVSALSNFQYYIYL